MNSRSTLRFLLGVTLLVASFAACSGGGPGTIEGAFESDGGATDAGGHDGSRDGASDARSDAPLPGAIKCGSSTCSATQNCLVDCCGGAGPRCGPVPASGVCPSGTHREGCGCRDDVVSCTPPPPKCIDRNALPQQQPPNSCTLDATGRTFSCVCG